MLERRERATPVRAYELGTLIRIGIAVASIGAGAAHLTSASAHNEHALIFAFFVAAGFLQIVWGATVLLWAATPMLLQLGALGSTVLIAVWGLSRTAGLALVEGADHREPIGVKDSVAVLLEILVIVGAYVLISRPDSSSLRARVHERSIRPLAAAAIVVMGAGLVAPAHHHSDHEHEGAAHGHGEAAHLAASHSHDGAGGGSRHSHRGETAGHTHAAGNVHMHEASGDQSGHAHSDAHSQKAGGASEPAAAPAPTGIKASTRYGPFVLPPASMGGEAHYNRILQNVAKPCSDCYIVSMRPDMVYTDGSRANLDTGSMLHHAVWTRPSIPDSTCSRNSAIGSLGVRFFASGNERTAMELPPGFGYRVGTDSWSLIAEIMNHSEQARTVFITLDVLYRPASDKLREVTPVWMDVDNCGDSEYAVPAGKSNTLWTWKSTLTGRVVSTGGHVHDGGVKTVLSNETSKQHMCTSVARYGSKPEFMGSVEFMSTCVWDRLGTVRKGETLGLRAFYDSSQPQSDVMGIMIAMVYETTDLGGGTAPPDGSTQPEESQPPPVHEHDGPH